jgi:hypothetical protein
MEESDGIDELRREADIIGEALHYREGKVSDLLAYCIMPNHVILACIRLPVGLYVNCDNTDGEDIGRIINLAYEYQHEEPL